MDFQVGDFIVMREEANDEYGITKAGATGIVINVKGYNIVVRFDKETLQNYHMKSTDDGVFTIDTAFADLAKNQGKSRVERKINAMWKRSKYYEQHCMV